MSGRSAPPRGAEAAPRRAVAKLHDLMRQRPALSDSFRTTWGLIARQASEEDLDIWAGAVLDLAHVNAGPACLTAFWRLSLAELGDTPMPALAAAAIAAAEICRHAGAAAALASIEARSAGSRHLAADTVWWRALVRLAREAPTSVVVLARHSATVLDACGVVGFGSFVAAGLKLAATDPRRQRTFFALEDASAQRMLERLAASVAFGEVERALAIYATALWGPKPILRSATGGSGRPMPRRASIVSGIIRVPEVFRGVPDEVAPALFRACIAHATAHLALGPELLQPGQLKPLQITLVGLIEDARVEALAMRRFPGLRRLWAPFHAAVPAGVSTAPALLARLARALFDPAYRDDNGFIVKARALFAEERVHLEDAGLSRRIGGLLGNDLGQMRIQFNAKTYVIEPAYRDDGFGLWAFDLPPDAPPEEMEVAVEAVRMERRDDADRRREDEADRSREPVGRARPAPARDRGMVVAHYPEWDHAAAQERPDWTTVREVAPALGSVHSIDALLEREAALRRRVERLVRGAQLGRAVRLKRQQDGPDLDLDAVLDAAVAMRVGEPPDERIHRLTAARMRDVAVLLLIDMSQSTADRIAPDGVSVLDIERTAVAVLAQALEALGDPFALRAFASNGRDEVRFARIAEFHQGFDAAAKARLAGLTPGLSTRLGTAIRHAGAELTPLRAYRKIVLALTDGEPSDVDVADPLDLVEDARRAVRDLRRRGIDTFGITLAPSGQGSGAGVFGRLNHMPVRRIEELPARLADLYFRLARR